MVPSAGGRIVPRWVGAAWIPVYPPSGRACTGAHACTHVCTHMLCGKLWFFLGGGVRTEGCDLSEIAPVLSPGDARSVN